jgi:hypothetical protein
MTTRNSALMLGKPVVPQLPILSDRVVAARSWRRGRGRSPVRGTVDALPRHLPGAGIR